GGGDVDLAGGQPDALASTSALGKHAGRHRRVDVLVFPDGFGARRRFDGGARLPEYADGSSPPPSCNGRVRHDARGRDACDNSSHARVPGGNSHHRSCGLRKSRRGCAAQGVVQPRSCLGDDVAGNRRGLRLCVTKRRSSATNYQRRVRQEKQMFRMNRHNSMVVVALSAVLLLTHPAFSQSKSPVKDVNSVISKAQEQVLKILQNQNACSAWFQDSDPGAAEVFQSLRYELDGHGESEVYRMRDDLGEIRFKHPWAASAFEYAGKDSVVTLNHNGPFFKHDARVRTINAVGVLG